MVTFKLFSFETFSFLLLISIFSTHLIISFQYSLEEHHAGLKVLSSRLKKLENLHLGGNKCNDSIFPSLTGFSSLKSLDLSNNMLTVSGIIHSFYRPKCFTWHSLNYIVFLSTKMRTLYLCKDQFYHNPSPKCMTDNVGVVSKGYSIYVKSHNKHIKRISYLKIHSIL